jgi:hypothetical protein
MHVLMLNHVGLCVTTDLPYLSAKEMEQGKRTVMLTRRKVTVVLMRWISTPSEVEFRIQLKYLNQE